MSRGIGRMQREAVVLLYREGEGGIPLAELRRAISADRSNARRAIRGLIARGFAVEVTGVYGERRVALTGGAHMALWLAAEYRDKPLTPQRVPGRPLALDFGDDPGIVEEDTLDLDNLMDLGIPHGASPPPPDRPVSDNAPSSRGRGDAMQAGISHASTPCTSDRGVNDNASYVRGIGLEIAARMAREWLERLDAEAGEEEA